MLVTRSCPTLYDPMEYSWPASCVHEILQAGILEWDAIPFSRGSSEPRDRTQVSSVARRFFTIWAIREACSNLTGASGRKEAPLVLSSPTEDSILPFFETKVEGSSLLWFCTTSDWFLIIPRRSYTQGEPAESRKMCFCGSDHQRIYEIIRNLPHFWQEKS